MNSALQCLVNCEALADYFLGFNWQGEINKWVPVCDAIQITDEYIHSCIQRYTRSFQQRLHIVAGAR